MDTKDAEAVLHEHREALRYLSRRELQARAKAFGVRANGKSVDIINMVAKVLSSEFAHLSESFGPRYTSHTIPKQDQAVQIRMRREKTRYSTKSMV